MSDEHQKSVSCEKCGNWASACICEAQSSLAAMPGSVITDTERVNWLDAHPLPAEVRGGNDDGATAKFWGISAYDGSVREAIDHMIRTGSQRQKPVEYEP